MSQPLLLESLDQGILRITLNRPDKRNALSAELVEGLTAQLAAVGEDPEVRVVAIAGAGKDFCAGADLAELGSLAEKSVLTNLADADRLAALFQTIRSAPVPVVAVVHGRALAGGCGLASACDMVVASASAQFGYPEVHIGFVPAMVMALLRRNVSEKRAFELVAIGDRISATEAERLGMINRVLADESFAVESSDFLLALASRDADALRLIKRLLYLQDGLSFEAALRAGSDMNVLARNTEGAKRGVSAFLSRTSGEG